MLQIFHSLPSPPGEASIPFTTVISFSPTSIVAEVPEGEHGSWFILLATSRSLNATAPLAFVYDAPLIAALLPSRGPVLGGQLVVLDGTSLGPSAGQVVFNNLSIPVKQWSHEQVQFTLPAGVGVVTLFLRSNKGAETSNVTFRSV